MNLKQARYQRLFLLLNLLTFHAVALAEEATLLLENKRFRIDTAISAEERAKGLMYQTEIADNYGMLFVYPEPHRVSFWMKNTYVALDILFFDSDGKLLSYYDNVPPCNQPPCPIYASKEAVSYVLELKGGTAALMHLKPGAAFEIIDP